MPWNWQLPDWPHFTYETDSIAQKEKEFLLSIGRACAYLKSIPQADYQQFVVEILSQEGLESSRIEGEILDRESLQSSIKQHFGLGGKRKKEDKEAGMATLLCGVYDTFEQKISHEMLLEWHFSLFKNQSHIEDVGKYRTHGEPMQIVSNRYDSRKVFFEAPPSGSIPKEMTAFIKWFNSPHASESVLGHAAITHLYFENIHPFEDGNGRIGRVLIEKVLSQRIGQPILIPVSKLLEKRKKEYYAALEKCNRSLDANAWVCFFADIALQAQEESINLLYFLIEKSKMFSAFKDQINPRQEKVLLRMFAEGPGGFKGGLSAENYLAITKTSRATATRDLVDLVQKGILTKTGELRHTRYCLNLPAHEIIFRNSINNGNRE